MPVVPRFAGRVDTEVKQVNDNAQETGLAVKIQQMVAGANAQLTKLATGDKVVTFAIRPFPLTDDATLRNGGTVLKAGEAVTGNLATTLLLNAGAEPTIRRHAPLMYLDVTVRDEAARHVFQPGLQTIPNASVRDAKGSSSTATLLLSDTGHLLDAGDKSGAVRMVGSQGKQHTLLSALTPATLISVVDQLAGRVSMMKLNDGPNDVQARFEVNA
jgi:hypothetical protein